MKVEMTRSNKRIMVAEEAPESFAVRIIIKTNRRHYEFAI
jgi:hypothetical protein